MWEASIVCSFPVERSFVSTTFPFWKASRTFFPEG